MSAGGGRRRGRRRPTELVSESLSEFDHVLTSPGIGKSAWFKDPDGNTLAVFQHE
jgi:hypothetical protein